MKFKAPTPIIRAAIVSFLILAIGWTGLDIPRDAIEETVDAQLDGWQSGEESPDTSNENDDAPIAAPASVTAVIDGDTVIVQLGDKEEKLRFVGIDTPETEFSPAGAECYGSEATSRARQLLAGEELLLSGDPTQDVRDVHGRLLVYAQMSDGRDFGEVMIAEGYAREYTFANKYRNQDTYKAAESNARESGAGLWSDCN